MFHTDLVSEYAVCATPFGLPPATILRLMEASFEHAFLLPAAKRAYLERLRAAAAASPPRVLTSS